MKMIEHDHFICHSYCHFSVLSHNPPHIHALYGDYNGIIDIQTLDMMEGDLPGKGLAMVREWMAAHQQELLDMWNTQNFRTLPPLV